MIPQQHSLRHLFHNLVDDCYRRQLGLEDTEIATYVADLLTDFSESDRIYALRDEIGRPLKRVAEMITASDPVHGTAHSFDAEREARKHIGNYALFFTGMYPRSQPENFLNLIEAGKESYYIVSQFNLLNTPEKPRCSSDSPSASRPACTASTWSAASWTSCMLCRSQRVSHSSA